MKIFVVFGVGLGNLGKSKRIRITATNWVAELNSKLSGWRRSSGVLATYGQRSTMDDSRTVVYRLEAENQIPVWLKTVRPKLIIRCSEGETSAYVITESAAAVEYGEIDRHIVRLRFDDGKAITQKWSQSTDNEALFA